MGRKQKQDWDVRTNISATPGAQGTLFSGGKQYASKERYHRGYDPERLNEVKDAVDTSHYFYPMRPPYRGTGGAANRRLVDTIARSTISTDDLVYKDEHGDEDVIRFQTNAPMQPGIAGTYSNPKIHGGSEVRPTIQLGKGTEDTMTTLHEIGHHVDMGDTRFAPKSHTYGETAFHNKGEQEGFADAYADTHFRDRRGRPDKKWDYPSDIYTSKPENQAHFRTGYLKARTTGLPEEPEYDAGPNIWDSMKTPEGQGKLFGIATSGADPTYDTKQVHKVLGNTYRYRFYSDAGSNDQEKIGSGETFVPNKR